MSAYTVHPLPRGMWRGTTQQEYGIKRDGAWLTLPPKGAPARFVSEVSAQRYADQRNGRGANAAKGGADQT